MGCEQFQDMMLDALYEELDAEDRSRFDEHVAGCEECTSALTEMRATLALMAKRERRDPGQAYWDGYWNRLSARMEAEGVTSTHAPWWRRALPSRALTYRAVAAAAILIVGAFIGRTFFPVSAPVTQDDRRVAESPATEQGAQDTFKDEAVAQNEAPGAQEAPARTGRGAEEAPAAGTLEKKAGFAEERVTDVASRPAPASQRPAAEPVAQAQAASANDRAMRYIQKSQMLLIALVNNDPADTPDAYAADFGAQQKRSRALVQEASVVKDGLDQPGQRRLRELVSELEKILIQIANLESASDVDGVEFIRSRVNDRDVLFKINLEQMRQEDDGSAGDNTRRSM